MRRRDGGGEGSGVLGRVGALVATVRDRVREHGVGTRDLVVVATAAVVASLAMARIYGRDLAHFGFLLALLYGGALALVGKHQLRDADLFSAVLAGLLGGLVAAFLVPGLLLGSLLGIPVSNVVYVLSVRVLVEVTLASLFVMFGMLAVFAVTGLRWARRDHVGFTVAAVGVVAYAAGDPGSAHLLPFWGAEVTARLESAHRLHPWLALLAPLGGGLAFLGLAPLAPSTTRSRRALAGTVAVCLLVGLVAVGNVYAWVGYGQQMDSVGASATVEDATLTLSEQRVRLTLDVHNPTERTLVATGGYLRVDTTVRPKVAWGGVQVEGDDGDATIPPGETGTLRYELGIATAQYSELRAAAADGGLTVEGPLRMRFATVRSISDQLMHRRLIFDLHCSTDGTAPADGDTVRANATCVLD